MQVFSFNFAHIILGDVNWFCHINGDFSSKVLFRAILKPPQNKGSDFNEQHIYMVWYRIYIWQQNKQIQFDRISLTYILDKYIKPHFSFFVCVRVCSFVECFLIIYFYDFFYFAPRHDMASISFHVVNISLLFMDFCYIVLFSFKYEGKFVLSRFQVKVNCKYLGLMS